MTTLDAGPIRPMLATLTAKPFHRDGWVYEEKYDGIRIVARRWGRRVRLVTRSLQDVTAEFPEVARALEKIPDGDFVLDGEIVALDRQGISRFQLLQRRGQGEPVALAYAAFDCLQRAGVSLLRRPLAERRAALERLVPERGIVMRARRLPLNGFAAYRIAQERGWEGIIAKDDASPYEPGRRSTSWLKVKCRNESEFVVGGYTAPAGQRRHFGALLVGLFDGPALRFAGKVGTGFSVKTLADLSGRMRPLQSDTSPFRPPAPRARGVVWVRPELVAQISFTEWTADGKLRQPVFLGLRPDKAPRECTWPAREGSRSASARR